MSKYVKGLVQKELEKRFDGLNEFMVVNTVGIDGITNNKLRGILKQKGIDITVVKNSLMVKALENMGVKNSEKLFSGSCTIAYGGDSIVDVAKEIIDWMKKIKALEIKGAYIEGVCLDPRAAMEVSKMPTKAQLQGTIILIAQTPGAKVAGAIAGPAGVIAGCIKSIIEKAEKDAA